MPNKILYKIIRCLNRRLSEPLEAPVRQLCILQLNDLSANDLSAVWCKSLLRSISQRHGRERSVHTFHLYFIVSYNCISLWSRRERLLDSVGRQWAPQSIAVPSMFSIPFHRCWAFSFLLAEWLHTVHDSVFFSSSGHQGLLCRAWTLIFLDFAKLC